MRRIFLWQDANIQRWCGQFDQPDGSDSFKKASISEKELNGLKITTIELNGTYKVAAGPMMAVKETKSGYRLEGAIVEGAGQMADWMTNPQNVQTFAKMAGPIAGYIAPIGAQGLRNAGLTGHSAQAATQLIP